MDANPSFKQLLEQSRQLTTHIVSPVYNHIDRGLEQIEQQTRRLLRRTTNRQDELETATIDTRAAYLLANKGFDADKIKETIDGINLALTFEPLHALPDTDIHGHIQNGHENIISIAIESQKCQTIDDFESQFDRSIQNDWSRTKRKIMEAMGHQPSNAMDTDQNRLGFSSFIKMSRSRVARNPASKSLVSPPTRASLHTQM